MIRRSLMVVAVLLFGCGQPQDDLAESCNNDLMASPLSDDGDCWEAAERIGCGGGIANQATTFGVGPDGRCWRSERYGLPAEWTDSQDCQLVGLDHCPADD